MLGTRVPSAPTSNSLPHRNLALICSTALARFAAPLVSFGVQGWEIKVVDRLKIFASLRLSP